MDAKSLRDVMPRRKAINITTMAAIVMPAATIRDSSNSHGVAVPDLRDLARRTASGVRSVQVSRCSSQGKSDNIHCSGGRVFGAMLLGK